MITEETKRKCMEAKESLCPFCNSSKSSTVQLTVSRIEVWILYACKNCGEPWKEIYKLVEIAEVN